MFQSDTDTEVIAHLTHKHLVQGLALRAAVQATVKKLQGAFAIAVICNTAPLTLLASKKGAPLLVGHGDGEYFLASDASAVVTYTKQITYLEENDVVQLQAAGVSFFDGAGQQVERSIIESQLSADAVELGPYAHYMQSTRRWL